MKKYKSSCILLWLFLSIACFGQEVTTASGDFLQNEQGSMSTTLGELVTETFKSNNLILTQGFQQSNIQVLLVNDNNLQGVEIYVYPNPVRSLVNIDIYTIENSSFQYQLFDSQGHVLDKNKCELPNTTLNLISLPSATYILEIMNRKKEIKSFKITKQ